jgi:hypothetical protein
MPEFKRNFTAGKMNKDLNERLVPKGEYRDAMNIEVSTSEGSDVGTVQNILGNKVLEGQDMVPLNSVCVGTVSDEKNDALYWFTTQKSWGSQPYNGVNLTHEDPRGVVNAKRDIIWEYKDNILKPVFCGTGAISYVAYNSSGANITWDTSNHTITFIDTAGTVLAGMNVEIWGYNSVGSEEVFSGFTIRSISGGNIATIDGDISFLDNSNTQLRLEKTKFFLSTADGLSTPLNFDSNKIINSINIIDDMLFWSDSYDEPKKINIDRSKQGTIISPQGVVLPTRLINESLDIKDSTRVACKKDNITVIRKAPLRPPTLKMSTTKREGLGVTVAMYPPNNSSSSFYPFAGKQVGDTVLMFVNKVGGTHPDLRVGDFLKLLNTGAGGNVMDDYLVRCSIVEKYVGPGSVPTLLTGTIGISSNKTLYKLKIQSLPALPGTAVDNSEFWTAILEDEDVLFERKFPRFAYRYKYIDNEYSSFSPFSEVAFLPGSFSYQPTKAYNEAMLNRLKFLAVEDFVPNDIPLDVVSVDVLYKNEVSPTVYLLDTLSPKDLTPPDKTNNPWNSFGSSSGAGSDMGSLDISTESIYAALPENQMLRSWDNVPKTAVAQEITSNRIIYGNYTQGYNMSLSELSTSTLTPVITTLLNNRPTSDLSANRSVKSLRSYDIGVVWGDKYGRETPVFASSQGSTVVAKSEAVSSNYFSVELGDSPYWADYYKFYIKETSNEYYNLPVGRIYDAEDGNIWVAFPSVDRNKVQEDTYIILKKGMESNDLVREEARYKIVAIENEAPEFVKTSFDIIAETNTDGSRPDFSCDMWGGTFTIGTGCSYGTPYHPPEPGYKSFTIDYDTWNGDYSTGGDQMGLPKLDELFEEITANSVTDEMWVQFSEKIFGEHSTRYHVTGVDVLLDSSNSSKIAYNIHLDQAIFGDSNDSDDSFITDNIDGGVNNDTPDEIHVHFIKKSIKNKPEFDGRFFVKIYKDEIAKKHLVTPGEPTITDNWVQRATVPVYSITDPSLNDAGDVYAYNNTATSNTSAPASCATNSSGEWNDALKMNTTVTGAYWFIDNATFASKFIGSLNSAGKGDHLNVITDISTLDPTISITGDTCDVTSSNTGYTSHWCGQTAAVFSCGGAGSNCSDSYSYSGDGGSNGRVGMRGVWEDTSGEKYIDLAYSKHGPSEYQGAEDTYSKVNWELGSPLNTTTQSETNIVGSLAIDQRFRFANDQQGVIYKILGTEKFRLFNWQGKRTVDSSDAYNDGQQVVANSFGVWYNCDPDWSGTFVSQNSYMHKDTNRRTTYRIRYEIDNDLTQTTYSGYSASDSFSDHPSYSGISGADSENIDFLDSYVTEEDKTISTNPAIFETEPKEGVDLDIYYEASSSIPVFPITNENKYSYIPVGTTFLPSPQTATASTINWASVFITSWSNVSETNPINTIHLSTPVTTTDILALLSATDAVIDMLKDNGEVVSIKISGVEYDANGDVVALAIEPQKRVGLGWFNCWSFNNGIESNRIGDTFNNPFISNGVAASTTTETQYAEEHRKYGLIYSGIYNSTSGVNDLNQFIAAEKITKDINPVYGSIQKLKAGWGQGGDLIALCEDRILKILANKDALYNADGNTNLTSTNSVLGQAIPYSGEYGISKNPESFASEAYRAYFTDRVRGTVMRLSMDGLTPISDYGMSDWFKDNLKLSNRAVGSFDDRKNEYNVSLSNVVNLTVKVPATSKNVNQPPFYAQAIFTIHKDYSYLIQVGDIVSGIGIANGSTVVGRTLVGQFYEVELSLNINGGIIGPVQSTGSIVNGVPVNTYFWTTTIYIDKSNSHTVTYKEKVKGWVSFKSFIPEQAGSMANDYYTFKDGKAWIHHSEVVPRNTFYGGDSDKSWLEVVINDVPGSVKSFKAVDYEGSQARVTPNLDANNQLIQDGEYFNLIQENGWYVSDFYTNLEHGSVTEFVAKEGKWFGHTIGSDISINPDGVITNNYDTSDFSVQGIGGFTSTVINNTIGCMCDGVINDCYGDGSAAFNYAPAASVPCDSGTPNDCCIEVKPGCIDPLASNFDPLANTDDGSCTFLGCIDEFGPNGILNSNYDPNANTSDGSCVEFIPGCTDNTMFNFSATATIACGGDVPMPGDAFGQTNNYCCLEVNEGCIDPNADAITPGANTSDGTTCEYTGCTNPLATNYDFAGSTVDGTTGNQADLTYQYGFAVDNGLCLVTVSPILGCTDSFADNYDATATQDDGSCEYCGNITPPSPTPDPNDVSTLTNTYFTASITHETTAGANNGIISISISAISPFGSNSIPTLHDSAGTGYSMGFTNTGIYSFSSLPPGVYDLTITQGSNSYVGNQSSSCVVIFDNLLTVNPGAAVVNGCTDSTGSGNNHIMSDGSTGTHAACNYNPLATPGNPDAANCEYTTCVGCMDSLATNDCTTCTIPDNDTCSYSGPNISGCMDPIATNYDASATVDDGTCTYAPAAYQVGDTAFGGIIAYFFQPGDSGYVAGEQHGIIVATSDNGFDVHWGCDGVLMGASGSQATGFNGQSNTNIILANCNDTPIAARTARDYNGGGYTDWFLPDVAETYLAYQNVGPGATGTNTAGTSNDNIAGLSSQGYYWTSSEHNSTAALVYYAPTGTHSTVSKAYQSYVNSRSYRYF